MKNYCVVYPTYESIDDDVVVFSCGATEGYEECRYSGGFIHKCLHKASRDCTSKKANLEAAIRTKKEMQSIIKSLKYAMAME